MKTKYFILMLAAAIGLTACKKDNEKLPEPAAEIPSVGVFNGTYQAYLADGSLSKEGTNQNMALVPDTKHKERYALIMPAISFSPKMPVALNIRFGGIAKDANGVLTLEGGTQVPQMTVKGEWTDKEEWMISNFSGSLTSEGLKLAFKCGPNRLDFFGKHVKEMDDYRWDAPYDPQDPASEAKNIAWIDSVVTKWLNDLSGK